MFHYFIVGFALSYFKVLPRRSFTFIDLNSGPVLKAIVYPSGSLLLVNDGRSSIPQYSGIRNALLTIYQQEGVRGLYRGVIPNVWGSGTAWGLYFLL